MLWHLHRHSSTGKVGYWALADDVAPLLGLRDWKDVLAVVRDPKFLDHCGVLWDKNVGEYCLPAKTVISWEWYSSHTRPQQRTPRKVPLRLRYRVLERDGGKCCLCGSRDNLHVDHIIPYSKGGETVMENLRALCADCNIGKGALMPQAAAA